jgi:hypothetical protein
MGTYTAHWKEHQRMVRRATLQALAWIVLGLPAVVLITLGVQRVTGEYPVFLQIALLLAWLVVLVTIVLRSSRVLCPRCGTNYARGKWAIPCPNCGLPMLQEEP